MTSVAEKPSAFGPPLVRLATVDDMRFVCGSWLSGTKDGPLLAMFGTEHIDSVAFWRMQRDRIHALISRSVVKVAVKEDGLIAAWVCVENKVLHYAYVRWMDRHEGILRRMLEEEGLL